MNIFWFRRDMRLDDNAGLHAALTSGAEVLPIFIFDENILSELPSDDSRVTLIYSLLEKINLKLMESGKSLAVFHGDPITIFSKIATSIKVETVFTNHDYEPYANHRDQSIIKLLSEKGIRFQSFKDQVIFEKNEITKDDGSPYVMFTPYSNKWKSKLSLQNLAAFPSESSLDNIATHEFPFLSLEKIGFKRSVPIDSILNDDEKFIENYGQLRNFPAESTSRLGPHLRFGSISIRQLVAKALKSADHTFLSELIWREFFMQILWHFPHTVTKSFKPNYDNIIWRNNERDFKNWCNGKTGYPIVDAGMRELNATGFMHNRVRMVVASFLCKHLLIDWRWGEAYFALKLLDYEQSSNVGNWQWAAGSGVDAAPYFRIFNPLEQQKKFDKDLRYVKKWVPEFGTISYSAPIVDHKEARERCLLTYKQALQ